MAHGDEAKRAALCCLRLPPRPRPLRPEHEDAALHTLLAAAPGEQAAWLLARGLPAVTLLPLTNACANRCFFCAGPGTVTVRPEDVTPAEHILRHLRQRPADVRRLLIGGNEPTLHPDFEGALRAARRLGYTRVELMTSGTTLAAGASAWRHLGLAEVVVPLYSADRGVHDTICGTPCFDRVVAGLDAADGAGIQVSPHTVALPETLDGLDALAQLCHDRWGARLAVGLLREKPVFDWAKRAPRLDAVREALGRVGAYAPLPLVAPRCLSPAWAEELAEEAQASLLARLYFMTQRREHPSVCEGCALKPRCPGVVAAYAGEAEALRPVWRRA